MYRSSTIRAIAAASAAAIVGTVLLIHPGRPVQAAPSAEVHSCYNIQLLIRPMTSSGAAGTVVVVYRIHDLWGGPCSLRGFPGLELLDRNFHSLPTQVQRGDGVGVIAGIPVREVVLNRQHDAYFALEYHHVPIDNQPCRYPSYLLIIPPNDKLPVVTYSGIDYTCGQMHVSPVTSTPPVI